MNLETKLAIHLRIFEVERKFSFNVSRILVMIKKRVGDA